MDAKLKSKKHLQYTFLCFVEPFLLVLLQSYKNANFDIKKV